MVQGRLTGVSWRELSSEATPTVSPASSTTVAKTMTSHAALGSAPSLRIGDTPLPVLGSAGVRVRHHPYEHDPCRARGHVRVGRCRCPGSPTGGGERRGVPQRDRRRRPRPRPGEARRRRRGDRWPSRRPTGSIARWRSSESSDPPMSPAAVTTWTRSSCSRPSPLERRGVRAERLGVLPWCRCRVESWTGPSERDGACGRARRSSRRSREGRSTRCCAVAAIRRR